MYHLQFNAADRVPKVKQIVQSIISDIERGVLKNGNQLPSISELSEQYYIARDIKSPDDFAADDSRRMFPRYQGENFYKNLELVQKLQAVAAAKGVTPAQLALAWVLAQGVVAIPGTKRRTYLESNVDAATIQFSPAELAELDAILPAGSTVGAAYPNFS